MKKALDLGWTINVFYENLNNWYIMEMTHPRHPKYVEYISESNFYKIYSIPIEHAEYMQLHYPQHVGRKQK